VRLWLNPSWSEGRSLAEREDVTESVENGNEATPPGGVSLLPILSVNFVGTLGFSIVLPFLVFLVTRWGGNALIYGVVGAAYSAFQLVGAPILGRWSDTYGRRRVLLLSQAGTLASWLVFLIAFALPTTPLLEVDSPAWGSFAITLPLIAVFFARAADGLTGGNVSVATAYLADITRPEDRNANFGKLSVSGNLGFILGPALAGALGATVLGEIVPVLAAAAISLLATLLILFGLPESNPCVMTSDPEQKDVPRVFGQEHRPCFELEGTRLSTRQIVALPGVGWFLAMYFLVMLGFNFFYVSFPVHAVHGLGWRITETGVFFAVLSGMMAFVQGPVLARASRRLDDGTLLRAGSLFLAASFIFFVSNDKLLIYVGAAMLAFGNGIMWPSLVSLLSKRAGDRYQGAVQGFASSSGAMASILGLLLGGALFALIGPRVFWISAVLILVVFFTATRATPHPRPAREPA
jgi:MFS family permease